MVVLAGGVAEAGPLLVERVRYFMTKHTWTCLPTSVIGLAKDKVPDGTPAGYDGLQIASVSDTTGGPPPNTVE